MTVVQATLVVPERGGWFEARVGELRFRGVTTRSARTQLVRAVRAKNSDATVFWSFDLPPSVASDVAAYRSLRGRAGPGGDKRWLRGERLLLARRLVEHYRLSLAEAAQILGITRAWLAQTWTRARNEEIAHDISCT